MMDATLSSQEIFASHQRVASPDSTLKSNGLPLVSMLPHKDVFTTSGPTIAEMPSNDGLNAVRIIEIPLLAAKRRQIGRIDGLMGSLARHDAATAMPEAKEEALPC